MNALKKLDRRIPVWSEGLLHSRTWCGLSACRLLALFAVPAVIAVSLASCADDQSNAQSAPVLPRNPETLTDTHPTAAEPDVQEKVVAETNFDQATISDQLLNADEASGHYEVIGQNTRNFIQLNAFFEAGGWNAAIDSVTMKSCPEGYEVFCRTRDAFTQIYQTAGGDVEAVIRLIRATDYRDPLYRLAVAADKYQQRYPNVYPPSPTNGRPGAR